MKILWTFDPFENNRKLREIGKNLILNFFDQTDRISAVYVASRAEIQLTTAFDIPKKDRFSRYPKKVIVEQLRSLGLKNVAAHVLPELGISLTSAVKKLTAYALKPKANLIVTSTHGKVGFSKFVLGSFAETLIHFTQTDLLLYNQRTRISKNPKTIVYAHDFSKQSMTGIHKLLEYAHKWDTTITLVHVPRPEYAYKFSEDAEDVEPYREFVRKSALKAEALIEENGIPCSTFITTDRKKSAVESILRIAKKVDADIVAVTAKSGRLAALLGGNITKNIIRESNVPTLVLKV